MGRGLGLLVLLLAAALEAGGDALVRSSLDTTRPLARIVLFLLGAIVLTTYGYTVNAPRWDFGKLLGIYVVFFFVVAQIIAAVSFKQYPTPSICVGGLLIIVGGIVIYAGR